MAEHVIRPIPLAKIENVPQYVMTYLTGIGPRHTFVFYIWYIEGPEKRIVVDGGATFETLSSKMCALWPGVTGGNIQSMEQGLGKLGLKPDDIDIVIITHLHPDHIELCRKFIKAKFIVQKRELEFSRAPHPAFAGFYIKKLFEGLDFEVVEGDREIVEGVKVILTPGHTPGGQSVVVSTAKGNAVITGFCCIHQNFEPPQGLRKVMPILTPGIHVDVMQVYDSVAKVKGMADIVVPNHEAEFAERDKIP